MDDVIALLFGAIVIVFFSYERFNKATYQGGGRHLQRLIDVLSPDKLRARRVVLNAYALYASTLLLIYAFLCAYAEILPLIGGPDLTSKALGASKLPESAADAARIFTGFTPANTGTLPSWTQTPPNPVVNQVEGGIGIDARVSLTVALILVGLAPTFPILQRFEEWMRSAAHRLAGIPTRVLAASEDLRRRSLELDPGTDEKKLGDTLLIPWGYWERLRFYKKHAGNALTAPEDFRNDLELIFGTLVWILDRKLKLSNSRGREQFAQLEDELRLRIEKLISALDEKTGFSPGEAAPVEIPTVKAESNPPANGEAATPAKANLVTWDRIAGEAEELADDLCLLLALYVEHEIIVEKNIASSRDLNKETSNRQQSLARAKLHGFLGDLIGTQLSPAPIRSHSIIVWLWSSGTIVLLSLVWSYYPGSLEWQLQREEPGNIYLRALNHVSTAFTCYCIPMVVVLAIRDAGIQANRWRNIWRVHWTVSLPQLLLVFVLSWAVSTLFVVGVAFWQAEFVRAWTTMRLTFEYNAPTPLRGSVLAIMVMLLLDAQAVHVTDPTKFRFRPFSSFLWGISAALVVGIAGGLGRTLTSWASAQNAFAPRSSLDAVDRGLIVYAMLNSAIIGFVVVFCVSELLSNHRSFALRRAALKRDEA
ncbi:hypothetical protein [Mesorhizobium onobrychidis]|uniref:Uncharacterized protein n=1 Tax=Mesorhizobium onobrychidis TaxID=2775404 RepID=A0ABY5RAK7_9HYPH|nr:hypothetical protein [Mesorhizobium onobrychidis]UVC19302.1 hypothetical protein IHQ72_35950 [Mesorhizobium onobrychidis]